MFKNKDAKDWTCDDVSDWLDSLPSHLNLLQYKSTIIDENGADGATLIELKISEWKELTQHRQNDAIKLKNEFEKYKKQKSEAPKLQINYWTPAHVTQWLLSLPPKLSQLQDKIVVENNLNGSELLCLKFNDWLQLCNYNRTMTNQLLKAFEKMKNKHGWIDEEKKNYATQTKGILNNDWIGNWTLGDVKKWIRKLAPRLHQLTWVIDAYQLNGDAIVKMKEENWKEVIKNGIIRNLFLKEFYKVSGVSEVIKCHEDVSADLALQYLDSNLGSVPHTIAFVNNEKNRKLKYQFINDDNLLEVNNYNNNNNNIEGLFVEEVNVQKENEYFDTMEILGMIVLEENGFVFANNKNKELFLNKLSMVQCCGQTALRDAVILGVKHLLKNNLSICKLKNSLQHKFVHIVLTDGCDTSSKLHINDLRQAFFNLDQKLDGEACCTFFVGVNLEYKERQQLNSIKCIAGKQCFVYNCVESDIECIFQRISLQLGLVEKFKMIETQAFALLYKQNALELQLKYQNYCVLFTLDTSGSMSGYRWQMVRQAVVQFCSVLNDDDMLGCILFGNVPRLLKLQ